MKWPTVSATVFQLEKTRQPAASIFTLDARTSETLHRATEGRGNERIFPFDKNHKLVHKA